MHVGTGGTVEPLGNALATFFVDGLGFLRIPRGLSFGKLGSEHLASLIKGDSFHSHRRRDSKQESNGSKGEAHVKQRLDTRRF